MKDVLSKISTKSSKYNMNKLKLLLFAMSPFVIGKLFSYLIMEFEFVGIGLSILSILFCAFWFFVGYKSYDYVRSPKQAILLGNSFAIISLLLLVLRIEIMDEYLPNIIDSMCQNFYLPIVRISSWIHSLLWMFFKFTSTSLNTYITSFLLMIGLYCCGYKMSKDLG